MDFELYNGTNLFIFLKFLLTLVQVNLILSHLDNKK